MLGWLRKAVNTFTEIRLDASTGGLTALGYPTTAGLSVSEQSALQVSAVFCALRVISEGMAQMPLRVVRRVGGAAEVQPDHWAAGLMEAPNEWQTRFEFIEYAVFLAALCGDFVAVKNTVNGEVRELLPVPPGNWSVRQLPDYSLEYLVSYGDKEHGTFARSQVVHLRGPTLNGYQGLRPVLLLREGIGLSVSLERHQSLLAARGGRPSGILATEQMLKPDQRDRLKQSWDDRFGAGGSGGIAVLDGGWKFDGMQMTSVDAEHLETRKHQIEEVARAFRVFPQMLMQTDKAATFASAKEFFRAHVVHTLGPWIERMEACFRRDILGNAPGLFFDFDERNLLRTSFEEQAGYLSTLLGAGGGPQVMTINEAREEVGLGPVEWGDKPWTQGQGPNGGGTDGAAGV